MANDMELQLSFSYDKKDLNNMLAQMENAIESADLDPNITGNTKKQLQEFQKEIQKFVKQTTKDFDKINGISLDSKAFDQYVKITDKRLDTLEGTVTQVIETLKGVDSSTDLSSIGKAFDNLKEKILANNAAIKEMVDTASDLGAKVKLDTISQSEKSLADMLNEAKELKRTLMETDDSAEGFGEKDFKEAYNNLKAIHNEYREVVALLEKIDDQDSFEYLKNEIKANKLYNERYFIAEKIRDMAIQNVDLEEKHAKALNSIEEIVPSSQFQIAEKRVDALISKVDKLYSKAKYAEGASIVSSSELEGNQGQVTVKTALKITTTSEQMFEVIKKRLEDVQKRLNNQTLVVPVKYTLGTPRENAENPLTPTSKEIKDAQKGLDFNWDKTYAKIEKQAIDEAEKAAKSAISSVQAEMDKNPVAIKFDIPASEKKRVSELLAKNLLSTQINIGAVLQEAVSSAKELRDLMQEVYDTSIADDTGSYLQRIRETTKQLAQAEKKEEKPSKKTKSQITNEVKEQANELHSQIQDSFNKNKIKIKLELEKAQLDSIRDKIADANLDKSLDIAGSLKEAVIASHNIAENLNSIKETNIKISSGRGTKTDLSNIEQNVATVLIGLKTINDSIGKLQTAIKNIGKNDSGVKDLTGDFDRIIAKLDEMMETSDKLVNNIRNDVSTIDTAFRELGKTINSVLDKENFGTITNLASELQIGFNSLIKMLFEVINAIDRLKVSSENIGKQAFENQLKALGEIDNEALNKTVELVKELDTTLQSIQQSSSAVKDITSIKNIFDALNIKDEKLEKINKIPDALKKIAEDVQELNNLPTSEFVEQIGKIAEQGEGLKALADILKNSEKKINAALEVKANNTANKKELDSQVKSLEKYRKIYRNFLKEEGQYSEVFAENLKEMDVLLSHIDKYKNLEFVNESTIAEAKELQNSLEDIADNLLRITKTEVRADDLLKKNIQNELSTSKGYERNYSRSWGFGKIEEGYVSEYSTKLSEIRLKLDEIEKIRTRADSKQFLQDDLDRLTVLNKELEAEFIELVKIQQISKNTTTTNLQNKIGQYIQKNTRLTSEMYTELIGYYKELGDGSKLTKQRVNEIATAFNNVSLAAKTAGLEGAGFLDAIKNKLKYGWAQSIAMFFSFYDIVRYIREISGTVTELNSSLIELAKVSDASIGELYRNFSDFKEISEETGGTINDIINATADWSRNGYNLPDSKELAKITQIYKAIGDGISNDQANEYLVSTLKGFNLQAKDALSIIDQMNNVSNNAAISMAGLGEGLERSSSALNAANTDLAESIAIITTASEIIQSPDTVGTGLKSMSARLRGATTELEEMDEETTLTTSKLRALVQALTGVDIQKNEDEYKSVYEILLEIGKEWENLTDIEQASLSEALFGKRNSQIGFAILNNAERLEEVYKLAIDSEGSAMSEHEKYMQSIQASLDLWQASVENLANTFMSSDFLKGMVQTGTTLVDILAEIIDQLGTIPVLVGAIGTAIGSKQNLFFNLAESGLTRNNKVLPLVPNSDLGALASTNSTKQLRALATEYANLGTELSNTKLSQEEFIAKIGESNIEFATWLEKAGKDAPNQLRNYQKSLIATTVKTTALRAATMLLQGALFAIAGIIITKVVTAISDWVHANERAIETGEEAKRTISDINNTLNTQQKTIQDSAKRFAELSQGVDQLTGKNLSLSDEDYKEFLDISNELAEVFPTLSKHYDENGNVIVDLNGDVNTITSSLNELLKVEEKLATQKILENVPDVYKGIVGEARIDYDDEIAGLQNSLDDFNNYFLSSARQDLSISGLINAKDLEELSNFEKQLDRLGIAFESIRNDDGTGIIKINPEDLVGLDSKTIDEIVSIYNDRYSDIQTQLDIKLKERSKYISSSMSSYLFAELSNDALYQKMNNELQTSVQSVIFNLDWNSLEEQFGNDWSKTFSHIRQTVLKDISSNSELSEGLTIALGIETKYNNNEVTAKEYENNLSDFLSLLDSLNKQGLLDEDTYRAIVLSLGLNLDSTGNIINTQVNNLTKQLESFVGEESAKAISEGLTKGELEAVQNSDINWAQILNKNQSLDTQIQVVKQKIASISQTPFEINFNKKDIEATTSGIKELQSTYQTLYEAMQEGKEGSDLAFLMSDIEGLKEKLVDAEGNVVDLGDTWGDFFNIMTDGSHSFEEMEDALNQVLTAYVNSTVDLENFDRAQADAISTQLQLAGVTQESADAYVDAMVKEAETVQWATDEGYNFATMSEKEIAAMLALAEQSGYSSSALAAYALEKQIVNGITITTSGDINNLIALAEAAGVTTARLAQLAEAKRLLETAEATGDANTANLQRARIKYLTTRAQEDTLAQLKALRNQSANLNYDPSKTKSSKSGGGSSKESDPWKEAYEKELAALDHLHEMELISDIQYYEEREKLNDKYFKDNTKYTEEYNKNLEEIYKGFQSAYKQYVSDMSDYWKKSLEAGKISFQQYCNSMKTMLDDLHNAGKLNDQDYYNNLADYYGTIVENYDKAINAVQRTLKKQIDGLEKQKEQIEKNYQAQIDSIQSEIDALNKANEERQKQLDLQKALYELNRAENQRTQMVYESDKGFVYRANEKDIKNAQDEVEQTQFEVYISTLEEKINSLEAEMKNLTDGIDAQIDKIQEYSDKWGEVANKFKEQQEDMVAVSIWGSDWKNNILALDEEVLTDFTNNYINMQQQQANAAVTAANIIVDSYNKQIEALNAWKDAQVKAEKTSGVSKLNNSSPSNNSVKKTQEKSSSTSTSNKAIRYAYKDSSGKVKYVYGHGTDNARPGYHEVSENGDEIILDNYGNAYIAEGHQLHRFEGGEKVFDATETQELLRGKYLPIESILPDYSSMLSKVLNSGATNNYSPTNAIVTPKNNNQSTKVDNSFNVTIGDIHVTEVDNVSQFAKAITNELPNALLQELNRKK